ncbi:transposase [Micromonospora sp. NPDC005161]
MESIPNLLVARDAPPAHRPPSRPTLPSRPPSDNPHTPPTQSRAGLDIIDLGSQRVDWQASTASRHRHQSRPAQPRPALAGPANRNRRPRQPPDEPRHRRGPRPGRAPGVGIDTAGQLLVTADDNPHRLHSEAAFARLCGVAPIPASSGRTDRHRLHRGGDRDANSALWRITLRSAPPPATSRTARCGNGATYSETPSWRTSPADTRPSPVPSVPGNTGGCPSADD